MANGHWREWYKKDESAYKGLLGGKWWKSKKGYKDQFDP